MDSKSSHVSISFSWSGYYWQRLVCKEIDDKEKEKLIVGGGGSIQRKKELEKMSILESNASLTNYRDTKKDCTQDNKFNPKYVCTL